VSHARWGMPGRLTRVAGRMVVIIGVAAMLAGSPEVVGAASAPRLAGHFTVTLTITKQKNTLYHNGEKLTRDWTFTPKCASGGCTTKVTIADPSGDFHFTLKPIQKNGVWEYASNNTHPEDCYAADDTTVIKKNGYSETEKAVLKVGHVAGGMVTTFAGTYALTITATSAAKALGCPAHGSANGTLKM